MQIVGKIEIVVTDAGAIQCRVEGMNREVFLMAMECAKIDTIEAMKRPQSPVVAPPNGLLVPRY